MEAIINVTQSDIDNGKKDSCVACPIALALNRIAPCRVFKQGIAIYSTFRIVPIPQSVKMFIQKFDAGLPVQPFSFALDV